MLWEANEYRNRCLSGRIDQVDGFSLLRIVITLIGKIKLNVKKNATFDNKKQIFVSDKSSFDLMRLVKTEHCMVVKLVYR